MTIKSIAFSPTGKVTSDQNLLTDVTFVEDNGDSYTIPTLIPTGERGPPGTHWFTGGDPTQSDFNVPQGIVEGDMYLDSSTAKIYTYTKGQFLYSTRLVSENKHGISSVSNKRVGNTIVTTFTYTDGTVNTVEYNIADIVTDIVANAPVNTATQNIVTEAVSQVRNDLNARMNDLISTLTNNTNTLNDTITKKLNNGDL